MLYDIGAARLRELGAENAARTVQFYKNYDEIEEQPLAYKVISYLKLISSGFGLYPEYGLYLFAALIIALWLALRSGGTNALVDPAKAPKSWFVFAVDSFIPVFSVDESFKNVEFKGWRHWMLYGARVLGILFAFILLKALEKLFETQ
ncbi:MAG TPA: hypothetical protein VEH77_17090 [Roseiarcus sp.]|nr:hypothetical protein [Roseiarcus sp.]